MYATHREKDDDEMDWENERWISSLKVLQAVHAANQRFLCIQFTGTVHR